MKFHYYSFGCFHFILRWLAFLAVMVFFTGAWYEELIKQGQNGSFDELTMMVVFLSGVAAFSTTRDKITDKLEKKN